MQWDKSLTEELVTTLQIELPDEVRDILGLDEAELSSLALEALVMRLYERGELSSGKAAELLGISRREFLDRLGQYAISSFDDDVDLVAEVAHR